MVLYIVLPRVVTLVENSILLSFYVCLVSSLYYHGRSEVAM